MNKRLKEEINTVFSAPRPTRKHEFLNHFPYPKTSGFEFVITQAGYIRKRFWCLSLLLLAIMIGFANTSATSIVTIGFLSAALPFLSLLGIIELQKSLQCNMAEMEMACRHNLGEVTLIRLSIIGGFHFMALTILLFVVGSRSEYGLIKTALYLVTPFLLCSYLSVYLANRLQIRDALFICGGVTGFISLAIGLLLTQADIMLAPQTTKLWVLVFFIQAILFIVEIRKFMKRMEELQWNLSLIA